jgi:hypothetical protein
MSTSPTASAAMNAPHWGGVTAVIGYVLLDTESLLAKVKEIDPENVSVKSLENVRDILKGIATVVMNEIGTDFYRTNQAEFSNIANLIGSVPDARNALNL